MQQTHTSSRRAWKRRTLSLLLAAVMMLGLFPALPAAQASAHWADPYLSQLMEWGVISQAQSQNPDRALTRADFMGIVNRAYGYHEPGETPFEDIKETDWFYDDVGIAYNARYIKGTSPTTASPNDPLTRETATTILGRNMMLQDSAGEILDFTDARRISTWAQGTVKSSLEHYLVSGYDDGTFRPQRNVSWGEMASMVTRLIGTPLQEPGDYSLGGTFGNVTITSPGVTLRDTVVSGDLYITGGVGLGGIQLENVTVLGRIIASGTGTSEGGASIILRNVTADELLVDNLQDNEVSLQADGVTEIGNTVVRTSAYIEDNTPEGLGLHMISLEGETYPEGEEPEDWEPAKLTLAGRIEEVVNRTPGSTVHVGSGTVAKLTVDEAAVGSNVIIDRGAVVNELILDTGVEVTGEGDIKKLVVNAPDCVVEMLPDEIEIRPGIIADIAGEEMDTVAAKESSEEPRILAGYPQAQDVIPTGLDAAFMTNKAGTIYWAVSAMTDGSVGEEDLIKPPSYGSIAVQHGSLPVAKGNEETIAKVAGLTPGGSYYLSAVLVDARDRRSPVKVISFTTPDNTVPAFCAGYPKMSSIGTGRDPHPDDEENPGVSQVVVMPNKDCKLYYALLPEGAAAPTEAELKSGSVSGALGYGVMDVYKNREILFKVHDQILEEKTTYVLYLWLTDADGINKGKIVSLKFTTADETPPWFIVDPTPNKIQANSVSLTFRLNENGTVYWVAIPSRPDNIYPKPEPGTGDECPPNSKYGKMQIESGMNIGADGKSGRVNAKENADGTITVSGLQPEVIYDFYYVAKDTAGNYSAVWNKISISTLDVNPPVITQSFELTSDPNDKTTRPTTDSDIYLDIDENVKCLGKDGGTSFRELYDNVRSSTGSAQESAINLWALNLYNAIKLNRTDGTVIRDIHERTTEYPANFKESNYAIDYTQAYVTTNPNNSNGIRIVFPNEGLNLESGARYYFTVTGLYDTSDNQNRIKPDPIDFTIPARRTEAIKEGHSLEPFDVAPPTVWFSTNPGLGSGDGPTDRNTDGTLKKNDNDEFIPETPDRYFRIDPHSTSSTNNSISYDILMWSDLASTDFSFYYRVIDPDKEGDTKCLAEGGKYPSTYTYTDPKTEKTTEIKNYLILPDGATESDYANQVVDANGWIWMGTNSVNNLPASGWSAKSVNSTFNGCDPTNFPQLKNLNDHLEYEFVISLERFKGNSDRDIWSGDVHFQFDVIAGQSSVLDQVTSTLPRGRDYLKANYIDKGLVSNIGWWDQEGQQTLELEWSRLAIGMPSFSERRPTFSDFTHESVTLNVSLTSTGTVHYVVDLAKSTGGYPEIPTTRKVTEEEAQLIKDAIADPDSPLDSSIWTSSAEDEIYLLFENLPEGVAPPPRSGIEPMPNWMKGVPEGTMADDSTADTPREKYNMITSPNFDEVASYDDLWEGPAPVAHGSLSAGPSTPTAEVIPGLQPNTDYYIYLVIDNDAGSTSHGYIYHFKTEKTPKPKVNIRPQTSDGTADVWTPDVDTNMKFVLFEESEAWGIDLLKQPFAGFVDTSGEFVPSGKEMPNCWGDKWKPTDTDNRGDDVKDAGFTVLDALMTTYSNAAARSSSNASKAYIPLAQDGSVELYEGGYSVFDIYANDEIRQKVDALIRNFEGRGTAEVMRSGDWEYNAATDGDGNRTFEPPIAAGATYVLLVAGQRKVQGADDPGVDYLRDAFKANTKIYKTDGEPPELIDVPMASVTENKQNADTYDFTILLKFDKNLYDADKNPISAEQFKKALLTVGDISVSDVTIPNPTQPASAFTIKGNTSSLPSGLMILNDENAQVIWNANHIPANKDLTIQFSELQTRQTEDDKQITVEEYLTLTVKWGEKSWPFEFVVNKTVTDKPTEPDPTPPSATNFVQKAPSVVKPTGLTFSNVSGAKLSGNALKLTGSTMSSTIKATITPSGATGAITWTSSDPKVASVSSTGSQAKITGLSAGTITITATVKGTTISKSITVTVTPAITITSFAANNTANSTVKAETDGSYTWTRKSGTSCAATLKFSSSLSISNANVTVTSSDKTAVSVGTVTKSGTTGQVQLTFGSMNKNGEVTITIKAGTLSESFKITLKGGDVSGSLLQAKK